MPLLRSCLYQCRVMHHRFAPKTHRFDYRLFLFALDLDELPDCHRKLALFSVNRRNLYSFREGDFLPGGAGSLKDRVLAFLRQHQIELEGGRVVLVTLPRVFGYLFNPVSFYFCFDPTGAPVAAVAEVTNTFREMKTYLLGPETLQGNGAFRLRRPKFFYVSPYSDVDVEFDFSLRPPAERLSVRIDDFTAGARTLTSTLGGPQRILTDARLAAWTFLYPLITVRIIALIHWHAFRLWLKRVPWFAKAGRPQDQREVRRPHSTPTPADA